MKISCIDIGGTYIKSGVLEDGVLTDVEETPTDGGGGARATLRHLKKADDPSPFPALTQFEAWGTEAAEQ